MQATEPTASSELFPLDAVSADHVDHSSLNGLRATDWDLKLFHMIIVLRSVVTFAAMVLCYFGYLPVWGLILANVVLYPAVYLRVHDIGHGTSFSRLGWAARFVPVTNPIWGGTRVFAAVHKEHHKYLGTSRDPWLPYYMGHPLRALLFNFIEPEYSLRQFMRLYGPDSELIKNVLYHVVTLVIGVAVFQWAYLIHLISQRIVHCLGIFLFNFYTHRATLSASAAIGTWQRESELRSVLPLLCLVWGRDTLDGLIYHNRHHCIGQQHIPVHNYNRLQDTGIFTQYHHAWPISNIKKL